MEREKFIEKLSDNLIKINVNATEKQLDKLYEFKNQIIEWNKKVNLTAITEDNDFIIKHLVDSLSIIKYIEEDKKIIDIGTGGGFPGMPIKIMLEKVDITLFDSLNKRINILKEISEKLELVDISCAHGRAEEVFNDNKYREQYDIATSRAVANLSTLAELMLPSVKVGGICICMKGNNIEEELQTAKKAIKLLGGEIIKKEKIILPETDIERNIIIIKKVKNTPKQYPRKPGTPQKKPL